MSDCPLVPMFERLIVKRDEAKSVTEAGLTLPEESREVPCTGVVLAVGPAPADWPALMDPFQPGQRVLFGKYAGDEVRVNNVPYLIVSARDIKTIVTTGAEVRSE